ncbi:MAG: ribosome biogenesis GTPase Der [Deltaproteobacteria bacterium]|nr:ribosome biogenesis GTPase Der [Deltaproteobacteria bacterium]MBW2395162.1 ribosome biogenesis GTPase Der [Deltaproteobacteria bacterium]
MPQPLPIVAIVGRPNVGKSTLFNRYAGHRRVLVEDTPGITRDRIAEEIEVGPRRVLLVDTAGLDADPSSPIEMAIQSQAQAAVEGADAILWVVDGQSGLLPQEEELARVLRRTDRPLMVAVNKIDAPSHAPRLAEFHALGLDLVRGVSAEHATGAWDALEELVALLPEQVDPVESLPTGLQVALVGRPNVGKSSLLNRLLGEERVVVSEVPGTTRDSIDIRVETEAGAMTFVDTAGIRRAARRKEHVERGSALMSLRAIERADVALVLVDAEEGFTDQDFRVLSLVRERGTTAALIVNKWDLVEGDDNEDARRRVEDELSRRLAPLRDVPITRLSAKSGKGLRRLPRLIVRLGKAASTEIATADLNRWLQHCVEKHEPSMAQRGSTRRPIKFFYATQVATRPPTLMLFCTDPKAILPSYRRFLINQLRERFDLAGVPVRLRLRGRNRENRRG